MNFLELKFFGEDFTTIYFVKIYSSIWRDLLDILISPLQTRVQEGNLELKLVPEGRPFLNTDGSRSNREMDQP